MFAARKIAPEPPSAPSPREALRQAIAARDAICRRMAEVTKHRAAAEEAVQRAQADIDTLVDQEKRQWAAWVADRSQPRPDVQHRRAELEAIHAAAERELAASLGRYDAIEQGAARDLPSAQAAVASAAKAVMVAEAEDLGRQYADAVERAQRLEAALEGLKADFAARLDGDGVAAVVIALQGGRTPNDAMRRRSVLAKESAIIRTKWASLGNLLLSDAAARVEDGTS